MKCPRCDEPLVECRVDEMVLEQCPRCRGTWFEFTQLERALGRDSRSLRTALSDVERGQETARAEEEFHCPRCSTVLVEFPSAADPELMLRGCLSCYGRWVERCELERVQQKGLTAKVASLLRTLWG